tara:strand:- start:274 stop:450 length:177 start_codon:yes stop_codon:yes gene_type:complete
MHDDKGYANEKRKGRHTQHYRSRLRVGNRRSERRESKCKCQGNQATPEIMVFISRRLT